MGALDENKRKLLLAGVLSILMITIMVFGGYFEEKLKVATLTQNNMIEFKEYTISNGNIKYNLPSDWLINIRNNGIGKSVYISEFISNDAGINGSVKVMNDDINLALEETFKELKGLGVKEYIVEDVNINSINSKLIQYDLRIQSKNINRNYEYHIPYKNCVVKVSFSVKDKNLKENTKVVFENIVKTFSFKE